LPAKQGNEDISDDDNGVKEEQAECDWRRGKIPTVEVCEAVAPLLIVEVAWQFDVGGAG
jgi:hypothetical protein